MVLLSDWTSPCDEMVLAEEETSAPFLVMPRTIFGVTDVPISRVPALLEAIATVNGNTSVTISSNIFLSAADIKPGVVGVASNPPKTSATCFSSGVSASSARNWE